MTSDKVSIIVPVYNAAAYLEETVKSVCGQSYENWELLLVDDCSIDGSRELIKSLAADEKRIRPVFQTENHGAAQARNAGIREASGAYVAFLDADDIWKPEKLERELVFLKKKDAVFVFCGYEFADENAVGNGKVVRVPEMLSYKQALGNTTIFTSTVLLDVKKLGKELIQMPDVKSEDTATWWKILRNGYTAYGLDENLVYYRRSAGTLSSNKMEAIKRIWRLYRQTERLSLPVSLYHFCLYAVRAVLRRI